MSCVLYSECPLSLYCASWLLLCYLSILSWYHVSDQSRPQIKIMPILHMWPDLTKAGLDAHIKQTHFPPPIDRSIHGLTIDGYFTVHSYSVCFPRGLSLWPVWRPRVHGCSSNGPGASWQVANWLKTSSMVDIDVRNRFGNILKG